MHIRIRVSKSSSAISDQLRAYAEYRIFSAIAEKGPEVRGVIVRLWNGELSHGRTSATCALAACLPHRIVRTKARSTHPAAAIDKAATRLAESITLELRDKGR